MVLLSAITCLAVLHTLGSAGIGTIIASVLVGTLVGIFTRAFGKQRDHISLEEANAKIKKVNHERAVHCKHFTQTDWGHIKNYDLCIRSDDFGTAETAQIIADLFQKKMHIS